MSSDSRLMKDYHEANALREAWAAAGNNPCDHPDFTAEVLFASRTGDEFCTTCGFNRRK